jgi:predicted nucleic acid-binding protein
VSADEVGILDTNAVILLDRLDPADLPAAALITSVTLAELSAGPLATDDPVQQALRQGKLQKAESAFDVVPFDASAARAFGRVASDLRRRGRKKSARVFDALIAATAIANDLPLYTCNPRDFAGIDELTVVAIPHPGQPADD